MTRRSVFRHCGLLALTVCLLSGFSALAQGTSVLLGTVTDASNRKPLEDVVVTATSPSLQGEQTVVTDKTGQYRIPQLPPGLYTLRFDGQGFKPLARDGIGVRLDYQVRVNVELLPDSLSEEMNVVAQTPTVDIGSATTGVNVSSDFLRNIAVVSPSGKGAASRSFEALAELAPGANADTYGVSISGTTSPENQYIVDGVSVNDPGFGINGSPLSVEFIGEVNVISGGYLPEYGRATGGVVNAVTKSGSNEFHGSFFGNLSPGVLGSASTEIRQEGGTVSGRSALWNLGDFGFEIGGPIVKDRLWFYLSGQMNFSLRETPLTFNGEQENRPKDTRTNLARLKLTWQPGARDRLSFAVNVDRNTISNNYSNANTALEAESRIARGGYFLIANYDHNFTDNVLFQLQTGATYKNVYQGPQNDDLDAVAHVDTKNNNFATGSSNSLSGYTGNYSTENKYRFQFDPTVLFKLGDHQMKAGFQAGYLLGDQDLGTSGNLRYLDSGGVCNPEDPSTASFCNTRQSFYSADGVAGTNTTSASVAQLGAFLQDRWTLNRQLTLVLGLRADVARLYGNNTFVTNLVGIGPRVSATYDVTNDRKTLLKAHYGRSNEMGDVFIAQHANPDLLQYTSTFNQTSKTFADCGPGTPLATGACAVAGGATGRTFDKTHTPPSVDEVSLGLHREVAPGAVSG